MKYYLNTYALIEISKANPHFSEFIEADFVVTFLTLAEFYRVILREYGEETADYWHDRFEGYAVEADSSVLKAAVKFRQMNKKQNFSFFDAVGYIYALANNIQFVTGDREFEGLKNVEFRKK